MDDTFIQSLKYYSLSSVCLPCPLAHPVVSGACLYIVEVDKITIAKNCTTFWVNECTSNILEFYILQDRWTI